MTDGLHCHHCGDRLDGLPDEPEMNGYHFCSAVCAEEALDEAQERTPCQDRTASTDERRPLARIVARCWQTLTGSRRT